MRRDKRAISPVIATIIIVAVAIVMSIAVAYWMMGLATTFTKYEKLEFTSAYVIPENGNYTIRITLKNTGTSPATITMFLLNGIPYNEINVTIKINEEEFNSTTGVTINPGNGKDFKITFPKGTETPMGNLTSGVSLEIVVQTAAGNQYPKHVKLP
ncbi:MAG: archaellin/type IV pilin N-terminal domain-containing protein [Candidatus Bathyarchaeia archaeon]